MANHVLIVDDDEAVLTMLYKVIKSKQTASVKTIIYHKITLLLCSENRRFSTEYHIDFNLSICYIIIVTFYFRKGYTFMKKH